jgi:hypothetical protein
MQGVPTLSDAQSDSPTLASEPTRKVDQPRERAITSSAMESTEAIRRERQACKEGLRH